MTKFSIVFLLVWFRVSACQLSDQVVLTPVQVPDVPDPSPLSPSPEFTLSPGLTIAVGSALTVTEIIPPTTPDQPSSNQTPNYTPTMTSTPTETATPTDLPRRVILSPMNHQWQTLNNCHRASIAALMGYYDVWFTQHDYDVAMDSLQDFLVPYGLAARVYGIQYAVVPMHEVVRWLMAEGIPAIVGQRLSIDDNSWHYRVVHGYDDSSREIISDDPLLGPDLHHSYERFDQLSRTSGQVIPVYPLELDEMIKTTMHDWQMKLINYP